MAQINHWLPIGNMLKLAHCLPGSDGLIDWVTYLHTDGLGAPRMGTDLSQNVVWRWDGEAFGQTLPNQAVPAGAFPVIVNLRYPGQYFDQETGLFYNMARYYNPQTGRFLQSDPIGLAGGINSYAYAGDGPLVGIDPLGLWSWYGAFNGLVGGAVSLGSTGALYGAFTGPQDAVLGGAIGLVVGGIGGFISGGLDDAGGVGGAAAGALGGAIGGLPGGQPGVIGGAIGGAISGAVSTTDPRTGAAIGGIAGTVAGGIAGYAEGGYAGAVEGGVTGMLGGMAGGAAQADAAAKSQALRCPTN